MFTGIVEEVGRIITVDRMGNSARLKIAAEKVLGDIKIGDSIVRWRQMADLVGIL